jgi:hypothetical protein
VNAKAELVRIIDISTPAMALDAALAEVKP